MTKIAIPTNGAVVDDHFGHCQFYTIYTLHSDNSILKKEIMPSPEGCGCKSDIASVLKNMGVSIMLAGNMGEGAVNKLNEAGLKVYRGFSGDTRVVTESYLKGNKGSDILCSHNKGNHEGDHSCNHKN